MLEDVIMILRDSLGVDKDKEITETTSTKNMEEWDSFGQIVVIQKMEQKYGLKFEFEDIIRMESVAGICQVIQEKQSKESSN